jgi:hypothetical protein
MVSAAAQFLFVFMTLPFFFRDIRKRIVRQALTPAAHNQKRRSFLE